MAVQISGNDITVPRDGSFTRNVTIGGTLTYEDVTNIDSVGLVTARTGIEIGARPGVAASISVDGNMIISGISTFSDIIDVTGSNSTVRLGSNASRRLMYRSGENDIVLEAASNFFYRQKISDTSHRWYTNGADEKLMITGAGLVGINSTSPTHNLDIHASGNPYLKLLRSGYNPVYIGNAAGEGVIETTGDTFIKTGGSERLRIDSGGNFGLGTASPTYKNAIFGGSQRTLHVSGTTAPQLRIQSSTSGQADLFLQAGNSGADAFIGNAASNGDLVFSTSNGGTQGNKARIRHDGGICFGTDNATANALDDYEEGTWTPNPTESGNNLGTSHATGRYVKIGAMVFCFWRIDLDVTSAGGHLIITGLPFTNSSTVPATGGFAADYQTYDVEDGPIFHVPNNQSNIQFYKNSGQNFNANNGSGKSFRGCTLISTA